MWKEVLKWKEREEKVKGLERIDQSDKGKKK